MSGPYVINDPALLLSLVGKDAVVEDPGYGVQCVALVKIYTINDAGQKCARSLGLGGGDISERRGRRWHHRTRDGHRNL